jgi:hypothetical protein
MTNPAPFLALFERLSDEGMMARQPCITPVLHEAACCSTFADVRKRMPGAGPILKSYFAYRPNYGV